LMGRYEDCRYQVARYQQIRRFLDLLTVRPVCGLGAVFDVHLRHCRPYGMEMVEQND
jgi:hypothetical protein